MLECLGPVVSGENNLFPLFQLVRSIAFCISHRLPAPVLFRNLVEVRFGDLNEKSKLPIMLHFQVRNVQSLPFL